MKRVVIVVLMLAAPAACVGGDRDIPVSPSGLSRTSPTPTGDPTRLDPVVLTVDPSERPARWMLVAKLPFGTEEDALGAFIQPPGDTGLNVVPTSFAVSADGSIWVLDAFKERVAHFSASGAFLGSVGSFPWHSSWEARDLVWQDGHLYVVRTHAWTTASEITVVDEGSQKPDVRITNAAQRQSVVWLMPGASQLTGFLPSADWAGLDVPGSGNAEILSGVPLLDGVSMDVRSVATDQAAVEVTFETADLASILPLHFRLVSRTGGAPIDAFISVAADGALPRGLACYVRAAPAHNSHADRIGSSTWFLQLADDGSPPIWERVREPGIADEQQTRHLTVGSDGSVYLMLAAADGVRIYRR
jgi:hypothetical protein